MKKLTANSKKKVAFVLCAHHPTDDRVFYHYVPALKKEGFAPIIISTKEKRKEEAEGITIDAFDDTLLSRHNKQAEIIVRLQHHAPDIIVCDYPVAVIAAKKYARSRHIPVIYEFTEWYPSKKNLRHRSLPVAVIRFFVLHAVNLYAGWLCNGFLFGEHFKSRAFGLFRRKPRTRVPYYPDTRLIPAGTVNEHIDSQFNLFYSGLINEDKGVYRLLNAVELAAEKCPTTQLHLTIMGETNHPAEALRLQQAINRMDKKITVHLYPPAPFPTYCTIASNYDLYFDLRQTDVENNHCLPIKLFLYLAFGKPVIYSDLRAIRQEVDMHGCGYLVNPNDTNRIGQLIADYVNNKALYTAHCRQATRMATDRYNWQAIEQKYVDFIASFLS